MSNFVIITDSTTDLSREMIDELDITVLPLTYIINGEEHDDKPVVTGKKIKNFYQMVRAGSKASTSQINQAQFDDVFTPYLEQGKDVLYIAFSSGLSGTYSQAVASADALNLKYANKVVVVDSLCASLGEGLLVYYAATMRNSGKTINEIANWLEENKLHLCHWFTVDDLNHLKRGGRVSPTVAIIGTMLGIKPVLHVDNEGHLINVSKVRGRRQSLDALVDKTVSTITNPEEQVIFISHGDCIEDAEYVAGAIQKKLDIKDIKINFIGPVIGAHSGPGTVAVFFLGTER